MSTKVTWSYWPQYHKYVLESTTSRKLGEDLVELVVLSPVQARKFAKMVSSHDRSEAFEDGPLLEEGAS
jgi:hypothetical protein